jgi:hypothetical protein
VDAQEFRLLVMALRLLPFLVSPNSSGPQIRVLQLWVVGFLLTAKWYRP